MKGNPNHPVVQEVEGNWHKLLVLVMYKFGLTEFEVHPEEFEEMPEDIAIVADARGGRFVLRLMKNSDAKKLARNEGGWPV